MGKRFSLRSLLRDRAGGAALEFAFVGPVFIGMMLVMFDIGYALFCQTILDGAARDAARVVRTGQAQMSGDPSGTFNAALRAGLEGVINPDLVVADVESFVDFSTMQTNGLNPQIDPNTGKPVLSLGNPGSAVAVRVSYVYNFMVPWLYGPGASSVKLQSTVVFKNEPYSDSAG